MKLSLLRIIILLWPIAFSILCEIWFYNRVILSITNFYDKILFLFVMGSLIAILPTTLFILIFNLHDLDF